MQLRAPPLMNGPRWTACFTKEMHSYTLFTLKLYPVVQPEVIPEVQPEIIPKKQPEVVPKVVPEVRTRSQNGKLYRKLYRKSNPEVIQEFIFELKSHSIISLLAVVTS